MISSMPVYQETNWNKVKVLLERDLDKTTNIVYKEILLRAPQYLHVFYMINILNEQDFWLTNNVMSAFRSALVSIASAQREPRV